MTTAGELAGYASNLGIFRNKIINGGMKIAQRGTSFNFAHDGTATAYTLDRFRVQIVNSDEYDCTVSQYSMSASEINSTGHTKALKLLTGTAESAVAADEYFRCHYKPEGQDVQDFLHGTASAKTATLSFWTKSSVTGTFGLNIYRPVSSGNARMINLSYTINLANTWEKKIISIVGDTGGATIPNDNTAGLFIDWQLAAGSNWYSSPATSWGDYSNARFMGNHSDAVMTTAGADWYLTGVQLENGSITPFETRPAAIELQLCQRYYNKSYNLDIVPGTLSSSNAASTQGSFTIPRVAGTYREVSVRFPVTMAFPPAIIFYSPNTGAAGKAAENGGSTNRDIIAENIGESNFQGKMNDTAVSNNYYHFHYIAKAEL